MKPAAARTPSFVHKAPKFRRGERVLGKGQGSWLLLIPLGKEPVFWSVAEGLLESSVRSRTNYIRAERPVKNL